jgi:hypothetical protein
MKHPYLLNAPKLKILSSNKSSLGTISYYFVIYDEDDFSDYPDNWIDNHESEIADEIEFIFEHPIYILYKSANNRAERIKPIFEFKQGNQFSKNITSFDSGIIAHCVAFKLESGILSIKSGFHYWSASDKYDGPISWSTMEKIYDGRFKYFYVKNDQFWDVYNKKLKEWCCLTGTNDITWKI